MSFLAPKRDVFVFGPAAYLPERVMKNQDVLDWMGVDIRPSWISHRTGITERRWVREDQACSDIAAESASLLLKEYGISAQTIGQLVLATISGDFPTPPTAPLVIPKLGLKQAGAVDLGAACAGFVSGLHVCGGLALATEESQLLISADIRSKFLRKRDLATTVLFGDGSVSSLVALDSRGPGVSPDFRLIASEMVADGSLGDIIAIRSGGSRLPQAENTEEENRYLQMKSGATLFVKAVELMAGGARSILRRIGLSFDEIRWVIPHQANLHLIRSLRDHLGIPAEKMVETVQFMGNTSGTSVGVALHHLRTRIGTKAGDKILLVSGGAGGSTACAVLESLGKMPGGKIP